MCLGYRYCPAQTNPEDDSRPLNPQLVCNLEWPKTKFRERGRIWGRSHLADHVRGELAKAVPMGYARLKSVEGVARYGGVKFRESSKEENCEKLYNRS